GHWAQSQSSVLEMQSDGNLVEYRRSDGVPVWDTSTFSRGSYLVVQSDGNSVLCKSDNSPLWTTATLRNGMGLTPGRRLQGKVNYLIMQYDGNLVLYRNSDNAVM
ncbi:hypothetical protein ACIQBJ_08675, partial [Kitasatospora sp. NPDC088391]